MTPLTREQIAAVRKLLASDIPDARDDAGAANTAVANLRDALPALLDIAEAVANGLTCEVRECCGHVIIGNEWDDEDATNKLIGKRVIVLPLAGEVAR